MQDNRFIFDPELKRARLGGQMYECVDDNNFGVLRNTSSDKLILIHRYVAVDEAILNERSSEITELFWDMGQTVYKLIYPYSFNIQSEKDVGKVCYTVCELPADFWSKYHSIDEAITQQNFVLHTRVVAALNLAEAIKGLSQYFAGVIYRLNPKAFFVNTETGDVKVILEELLNDNVKSGDGNERYLTIFRGKDNALEEKEFTKYEAYSIFRLLCVDNPFDGQETLKQYPLLTLNAVHEINSGKYDFIFYDGSNKFSEYIGRESYGRWKSLPSGLRKAIENELRVNSQKVSHLNTEDWLKQVRILRDCLVFVNGQFRLCDPDTSNNVMFMEIGDYKIPIWHRKAVYWYHVGIEENSVENGVFAGINAEGAIENRSKLRWKVKYDTTMFLVESGEKLKPKVGMQIDVDGTCMRIISGEIPVQNGVVPENSQDCSEPVGIN